MLKFKIMPISNIVIIKVITHPIKKIFNHPVYLYFILKKLFMAMSLMSNNSLSYNLCSKVNKKSLPIKNTRFKLQEILVVGGCILLESLLI